MSTAPRWPQTKRLNLNLSKANRSLAMIFCTAVYRQALVLSILCFAMLPALAVTEIRPDHDGQVIEILPAARGLQRKAAVGPSARPAAQALSLSPASVPNASQALLQAKAWVDEARQTGDTRYWGRAQAVLAPWWDSPQAPPALMVMQATVQQGRHAFAAAHTTLTSALKRDPDDAQAWLTLASLERLAGRYTASLQACEAVARARQPWYARVCRLETESLQGRAPQGARDFQRVLSQSPSGPQAAWVHSLLAESEERAGHDAAAALAYQKSLQQDPDLYTSLAYGDLLLRTSRPRVALKVLAQLPATDAVLIRRAHALRLLGDVGWKDVTAEIHERDAALRRLGDDVSLHAREAALIALWLDDKPDVALQLAQQNLQLQKEPIDWWLALQSARAARDGTARDAFRSAIAAVGLKDQRLENLVAKGHP
jgi:tetratricopeptide (TPR) repeat protein